MQLSESFSNWHIKRNILGKVLVLGNRCINICPEKCILSQIPVSSQLAQTQGLCGVEIKTSAKSCYFVKNYLFRSYLIIHDLSERPWQPQKSICNIFQDNLLTIGKHFKLKLFFFVWENRARDRILHGQMKLDLMKYWFTMVFVEKALLNTRSLLNYVFLNHIKTGRKTAQMHSMWWFK